MRKSKRSKRRRAQRFRSARTGRFITKRWAQAHPFGTVCEAIR